ncbi:MAG: VanZ family protein [Cytophagales bacterium]|nr:VanZ family protein [Cytophagales bacterium]
MIIGFTKQGSFSLLKSNPVKYSLIISTSYAGVLELVQAIIPGRHANFYDLTFNFLGVFIGYAIFVLIYKFSFD